MNTVFGYGAYALFVRAGLHPLVAQACAQVTGVLFNMRSYGVAFRTRTSLRRFVPGYATSYLAGAALLALFTRMTGDAYVAGALTMAAAGACNYVVLRRVFRRA